MAFSSGKCSDTGALSLFFGRGTSFLAFLSAVAILDSRCCHAFSSPLGIQSTRSKSYDASDASCPIWGERRVTKQGIFSRRCIVLEADQDDQSSSTNQDTFFYSPNIELDETRYRYDLGEADGEVADESSNTVGGENEFSFFDEAIIYVRAGSGGQGSSTYKKGVGRQDAQPDGGSGGKGGDVILVVDDSLNTLAGLTNAWRPNRFGGGGGAAVVSTSSQSFRAENGQDGGRMFKNAKFGGDAIIRVPPGTVIQQAIDIKEDDGNITTTWVEIGSVGVNDDVEPGVGAMETLVVALGGEGGEGSGSVKKVGRGVKRVRSPPVGGERKCLKLTLKIVADVALVGVPNTGKSTFLAAVTRAKPKIANYPFTTVIPNLGVWVPPETDYSGDRHNKDKKTTGAGSAGLVLCDVPGLIAGAAEGVGLGHAFLRHVERCHVILHLVDATSNDPIGDFNMLNREILRYGNGSLAQMPQIVVINKMDAWQGGFERDWEKGLSTRYQREELEAKIREAMPHSRLMFMSAKEKDGVDQLMSRLAVFVSKVKEAST